MLVVKIGTAHEIMATGTSQFALLVDQFMSTLQTIAPMLSLALIGLANRTFVATFVVEFHRD